MHVSAARRRHRRGRAAPPSRREQAALRASASQVSASGAIVESAASGAGGASAYGAIVVSATSGVDAGAGSTSGSTDAHRCGNPNQISSSGSLGALGSGGGAKRRARFSAVNSAYANAAAAAAYDWRAAVCVCVCVCGWRVARTPSCRARTLSSRAVRLTHNPPSSCSSPLCCVRVGQRPPRPYTHTRTYYLLSYFPFGLLFKVLYASRRTAVSHPNRCARRTMCTSRAVRGALVSNADRRATFGVWFEP